MASATALTFHRIVDGSDPSGDHDPGVLRYALSRQRFTSFVELMSGFTCLTLQEFVQPGQTDGLILTFDDGFDSDYQVVFPLLAEHDMKGTFFLTADNVGKAGYMTSAQARALAESGNEIGSHGLTHSFLVTKPRSKVIEEIVRSKDRLEQLLGLPVTSFAPVGGHYRYWMVDEVWNAGYIALATMIPGVSRQQANGMVLLRRNHLQRHHGAEDLARLLGRDRMTMLLNRLRYELLAALQWILGLPRYDRLKARLLAGR